MYKMIRLYCYLCSFIFLASCSSVEINTAGYEKFYVASHSGSDAVIEKDVTLDFYFWGSIPNRQDLVLVDALKDLGIFNPSYVVIEQKNTLKNMALTLLTFGLYSPVAVNVKILSNKEVK